MGKYIGPDRSLLDGMAFFVFLWIILDILEGISGNMWKTK